MSKASVRNRKLHAMDRRARRMLRAYGKRPGRQNYELVPIDTGNFGFEVRRYWYELRAVDR